MREFLKCWAFLWAPQALMCIVFALYDQWIAGWMLLGTVFFSLFNTILIYALAPLAERLMAEGTSTRPDDGELEGYGQ